MLTAGLPKQKRQVEEKACTFEEFACNHVLAGIRTCALALKEFFTVNKIIIYGVWLTKGTHDGYLNLRSLTSGDWLLNLPEGIEI